MAKYIDAEKLKKSIGNYVEGARAALNPIDGDADYYKGKIDACKDMQEFITAFQQEQPEVDLDKIIGQTYHDGNVADTSDMDLVDYENIARHFYELGNRALEEAVRHVYESWMGGTMDDVRRDMAELGKILSARKGE